MSHFTAQKPQRVRKPFRPILALSIFLFIITALASLVIKNQTFQPRLGLDLRGGTTIVLQPQLTEIGKITSDSVKQAVSILRQRIDGVGVSESEIRAEGSGESTKIIVSVPGTTQRELVALVGQTAKLSIRPVLFVGNALTEVKAGSFPKYVDRTSRKNYQILDCAVEGATPVDDPLKPLVSCDQSKATKYILGPSQVQGSQVDSAQFALDQGLGWTTDINFDGVGSKTFGELTAGVSKLAPPRNQIAIVLDGKVVTAPRVDGPLTGGNVRIYGNFTREYASELSNVLKYGALPFSFRVDEVQQISASLGAAQLKSGIAAGLLGLILISFYLFFYYRGLGVLAVGSLIFAFIITYEIFLLLGNWIGLTLTLAGIAGAIVSIGVTADSFIVFFERVRDELRVGSSLQLALIKGWDKARRTILVADAVSLIAAFVLYFATTGNVRGFAFTLGLTTFIDLLIVYLFTRPGLFILAKLRFFKDGHPYSGFSQVSLGVVNEERRKKKFDLGQLGGKLFRGETSVNIIAKPQPWYILSGLLIAISAASFAISGVNLGLEFKGGSVNTVTTSSPSVAKAEKALKSINYSEQAIVQIIGKEKVRIETAQLSNELSNKLVESMAKEFKVSVDSIDSQSVGPSWGAEISQKALMGLFWFLVILTIYLTFALEIRMALAALIAVLHDVFITVGLYSLIGLKVTPAATIGFLTILGYSLYDTVVVFDKVRENTKLMGQKTIGEYKRVVNLALNQTLIRSLNTSIVAIIPIASILFVGAIILEADTLKDISLALVIGQTIGTYSSIFIAAPALVKLNQNKFKKRVSQIDINPTSFERPIRSKSEVREFSKTFEKFRFEKLSETHAPMIFRTLFQNQELLNNIWIKEKIPTQLESCAQLIRTQVLATKVGPMQYYIVNDVDSNKSIALIAVSTDLINANSTLELLGLMPEFNASLPHIVETLRDHFFDSEAHKFSFILPQTQTLTELMESTDLLKEGELKAARLQRSGERINLGIYSANIGA